jgi:DNA-binding SARP family transcriptional activator
MSTALRSTFNSLPRKAALVRLNIQIFGVFRLTAASHLRRGAEIVLPTSKAQALMSYLAMSPGRPHGRDKLMTLLWSDRGEAQARHSLRQTLFSIRRALSDAGVSALTTNRRTITLDADVVEVDVLRFEQLIAEGTSESLARAMALYESTLLEGLNLRREAFEEWLTAERRRYRELAVHALGTLLELYDAEGNVQQAIHTTIQLLAVEPLQEAAHRRLMQLFARQGRRAAALRQYRECEQILRAELGVEPEPETIEVYRGILRPEVPDTGRTGDQKENKEEMN